MAINWFPGHMNKARKEIAKAMPKVSLIFEVLDARIPFSGENPLVSELRGDKPCIKLLNKIDLADPVVTDAWMSYYNSLDGVHALPMQATVPKIVRQLPALGKRLLPADRAKDREVLAMIVGIPNVGKSTIINTLKGRGVAKTGNVPAVTRQQQRVAIDHKFYLLDTPGFLWPRLSPVECGYRLAATGSIRDGILEFVQLGTFLAEELSARYPEALMKRYKLPDLPAGGEAIIHAIGAKRGCIQKGGTIDMHKASEILIMEFRQGKIGRLSLEHPPNYLPT